MNAAIPDVTSKLHTVMQAIYGKHVLSLRYFGSWNKTQTRLVEPYAIWRGPEDAVLRAYQIEPAPGWRFFHMSLVESVSDTGQSFTCRRPVLVASADTAGQIVPVERHNREQAEYRKLLLGCLADMHITPEEESALSKCRQSFGLTPEEVRGVHYRVFSECLNSMVQDSLVSDAERQTLKDLNQTLHQCGVGLIE